MTKCCGIDGALTQPHPQASTSVTLAAQQAALVTTGVRRLHRRPRPSRRARQTASAPKCRVDRWGAVNACRANHPVPVGSATAGHRSRQLELSHYSISARWSHKRARLPILGRNGEVITDGLSRAAFSGRSSVRVAEVRLDRCRVCRLHSLPGAPCVVCVGCSEAGSDDDLVCLVWSVRLVFAPLALFFGRRLRVRWLRAGWLCSHAR